MSKKRKIIKEMFQPIGEHNPEQLCVATKSVDDIIKYPFSHFNPMQSSVVEVVDEDCNVVVASPTASGKTIAMELFVAKTLSEGGTALCLFPLKSLTEEKLNDWNDPAHTFSSKKIVPITGDHILTADKKRHLSDADIIVATSEMLDSKTRNYANNEWLEQIKVLVVDEVHLIGSPARGPKLESALMRFCKHNKDCRVILMSATAPNKVDILEWLGNLSERKPVLIDSNYRPCKLNKHFVKFNDGVSKSKSHYSQVENIRMAAVKAQIEKNSNDQHLIFTGTKMWGYTFKEYLATFDMEAEFHSADLGLKKRTEIEDRFKKGEIKYLISTSTLAWGCHAWGSMVCTEDGLRDVKDIKAGDYVTSVKDIDDHNRRPVTRRILRSESFYKEESFIVTIEDRGLKKKCHVTKDHMFYVYHDLDGNGLIDWVEVKDVKVGQTVLFQNCFRDFPDDDHYYPMEIVSIEEGGSANFQEIEVEDLHNYICDGFVSHNCNLPARRVILAHTSYGLEPMEICDIEQVCGRSGRPKYDSQGDAYIMIPASIYDEESKRVQSGFEVLSHMHEVGNLVFNAVSEVTIGNIRTKEDLYDWFKHTLAHVQGKHLTHKACNETFDKLVEMNMISVDDETEEHELYDVTQLGKITSYMYQNPFDVYYWYKNFRVLSNINPNSSMTKGEMDRLDVKVCLALASCYEYLVSRPFASRAEKDTKNMSLFAKLSGKEKNGVTKVGACYFALMSGGNVDPPLRSLAEQLRYDLRRTIETIKMVHERYGKSNPHVTGYKYNPKEWDILYYRIMYGVDRHLCPLVSIPGIGKEYAKKLYAKGISKKDDLLANPTGSKDVLGEKRYKGVLESLGIK